jgi:hypothetical protein
MKARERRTSAQRAGDDGDPFDVYDANGNRLTDGQRCHTGGRVLYDRSGERVDRGSMSLRALLKKTEV